MKNMTKQKRRKLEKKRREDKQKRKSAKTPPLVYTGNKYRAEKYVFITLATETGILEAHVVSDRSLTDSDIKTTVIEMIGRLRKGPLPALADMSDEEKHAFGRNDLLIWSILAQWQRYFEEHGPLGKDTLIGVLRTILGSIDFRRSNSPAANGYLEFLEDFLGQMGVTVRQISQEEFEQLELNDELNDELDDELNDELDYELDYELDDERDDELDQEMDQELDAEEIDPSTQARRKSARSFLKTLASGILEKFRLRW